MRFVQDKNVEKNALCFLKVICFIVFIVFNSNFEYP